MSLESDPESIPSLPARESWPLSAYQRGMWSLLRVFPTKPFYNASRVYRLAGPLDFERFRRAFQAVVDRHITWRTAFVETADGAVQKIADRVELEAPLVDLTHLDDAEREHHFVKSLEASVWLPFDLDSPPLARVRAFRFTPDEHRVVLTVHHLILDGPSSRLLLEELAAFYQAFAGRGEPPPKPELQYTDFSDWNRRRLATAATAEKAFWADQLGGDLPALELPTDRLRPPLPTFRGAQVRHFLPPALGRGLQQLRHRSETTYFRMLLAVFNLCLARWAGTDDPIIGTPVSARTHPDLRRVQGLFVNMLALRTGLAGDPSFLEVLERVKDLTREAFKHREYPFDAVVQQLNPQRDVSRPPIFNVGLVLRERNFSSPIPAGDVVLYQDELPSIRVARYDLTLLAASMDDGGLRLTFEYAKDLFDAATIHRLGRNLECLVTGLLERPEERISRLPLLTAAERQAVMVEWQGSERPELAGRLLPELCAQFAAQQPAAVALVDGDDHRSYGRLFADAARLGARLPRGSADHEVVVGICLERSADLVLAALAAWSAGAAFLPLDPSYPRERLAFMLDDARPLVVVTRAALRDRLPASTPRLLLIEDEAIAAPTPTNTLVPVDSASSTVPADLAYLIYTSGSTGRPKGVAVTHAGLVSLAAAQTALFDLGPSDRVLHFASPSFDAAVFEMVMALAHGAALHVVPPDAAAELPTLLAQQGITSTVLPPSALAILPSTPLPALQTLIVAGEACSEGVVDRWGRGRRFFNAYGPTEATIWSTGARCRPGPGKPPIGRAIPNVQTWVLDRRLGPRPIGAVGELCLGGIALARGYLRRPGLTATRFLPDPNNGEVGARLYRTGDLVRWRTDGQLDYLGRTDHQVKVRGFRIELGEIETVLTAQATVQAAAVTVRNTPSGARLAAYLVPADADATPPDGELRRWPESAELRRQLPTFMVPEELWSLARLPLSPTGKVDRGALPHPGQCTGSPAHVPPRDDTETALAELWENLLAVERVGIEDNFFELGGHSLAAVALVARLRQEMAVDLSVAELMLVPTIAELATHIRQLWSTAPTAEEPPSAGMVLLRRAATECPPLFCVHAFRGGVFAYHTLATALVDEVQVWGLQAPGLADGETPVDSVDALADLHSERLRRQQPRGPYRLVGWSFGGTIAWEIARRLEQAGETVDSLVLIDACPPDQVDLDLAQVNSVPEIAHAFFNVDVAAFDGLDERQALDLLLKQGQAEGVLTPGMSMDHLGQMIAVIVANARAFGRHRLSGSVRADIHLLRAEDGSQVDYPESWRQHTSGRFRIVGIPGSHHQMLDPPGVSRVAEILSSLLTEQTPYLPSNPVAAREVRP